MHSASAAFAVGGENVNKTSRTWGFALCVAMSLSTSFPVTPLSWILLRRNESSISTSRRWAAFHANSSTMAVAHVLLARAASTLTWTLMEHATSLLHWNGYGVLRAAKWSQKWSSLTSLTEALFGAVSFGRSSVGRVHSDCSWLFSQSIRDRALAWGKKGCWTRRAREITGDFQNHLQSIHTTLHHCCEINLLVEDLALEADGINPCQICVATQCALLLLCATFQAIRTFAVSYDSSMLLFRFLALQTAWNTPAWGMSCSQKHGSKLWKKVNIQWKWEHHWASFEDWRLARFSSRSTWAQAPPRCDSHRCTWGRKLLHSKWRRVREA